jgi:hypothetical protein
MTEKERIAKFYDDIIALGMKFPGAMINKETGYSKGLISRYLNKTLEPSTDFLDRFYEKFKKRLIYVSRELPENVVNEDEVPITKGPATTKAHDGDEISLQMLADLIKGNLELIENNKMLTRINEKQTAMLDKKMIPVSLDLFLISDTLKALDSKVNSLLQTSGEAAVDDPVLKSEIDADDRNRAIADQARKNRGSGTHKHGKRGS